MAAQERRLRAKLAQLVSKHGFVRGSLQARERVCGKPNCKCTQDQLHRSLYLVMSKTGKIRQLYVPRQLEATVREWVSNYRNVKELLEEIRDRPEVRITTIGQTVEGRALEIIRIGSDAAPHRVLLRARAHPWEPGGNWVVQGMIRRLLADDRKARAYRERYCVSIMPIANKDGVARGWTRFNVRGMDLNRNWDRSADPVRAPENHALETWIKSEMAKGRRPDLMIDFHNDEGGRLHISRPNIDLEHYLARMKRFESLLKKHTWFTEGATGGTYRNPGTIGEGLLERYGIHACVHELNANWIAGLEKYPSGTSWELYGTQLCEVLYALFGDE